jgi:CxxC motif-containing protein (DUF1111 family)
LKLILTFTFINVRDVTRCLRSDRILLVAVAAAVTAGAACGDDGASTGGPRKKVTVFGADDPFDVPATGLAAADLQQFEPGDALFGLSLREYDGLGPLYTRTSCGACHQEGERGPGVVQKMVVVEPDGWTASADQGRLPYGHTVHPLATAGALTAIVPPAGDPSVKVTTRLSPAILGRGYLEAIADAEIERIAAEQAARGDAIHGRVNHVVYASQPNPETRFHDHQPGDVVIGRFGLKARIGTVDDFTADALQGDMGITSPLRPAELPNPDGLIDDLKPGPDVTIESVNRRALYVRMTAIPARAAGDVRGPALFAAASCAVCHVPSLATRPDYPLAPLAGIDAPIYSDLLLHDMGSSRADGISEGEATGSDWRTAPLIGLRFERGLMHDGIASTVDEAIAAHAGPGSEANDSVAAFMALSAEDRALLLAFVSSL